MSIIEYPTYCINLDRCSERKKVMENQFKKYNINYTFCKAIDANDISFGYEKDIKYNWKVKDRTEKMACISRCMLKVNQCGGKKEMVG